MTKTTENFCKTRNCPSTAVLLLYSAKALEEVEAALVSGHLFECEFCAAELELLTKHPPGEARYAASEIPVQLRRLAEILLGSRQPEFQLLRIFLDGDRFMVRTELPLLA